MGSHLPNAAFRFSVESISPPRGESPLSGEAYLQHANKLHFAGDAGRCRHCPLHIPSKNKNRLLYLLHRYNSLFYFYKFAACLVITVQLQHAHKCFLRNFYRAQLPHSLFTLFLLLQQLFLTGNIAAVALGKHVFPHGLNGFSGNDLAADRRLYRHLKQLPRNVLFQLLHDFSCPFVCLVGVNDKRQGIDNFAVQQYVQFYQLGFHIVADFIIKRAIAIQEIGSNILIPIIDPNIPINTPILDNSSAL